MQQHFRSSQNPELTKIELAELAAKKLAREARTVQVVVNSFLTLPSRKQETWQHGGRDTCDGGSLRLQP